jgi:hypothetical protein
VVDFLAIANRVCREELRCATPRRAAHLQDVKKFIPESSRNCRKISQALLPFDIGRLALQGGRVSNSEEQDLARAMIRLYGADAESVAAGHAETHAEMGDKPKSDKWRRIASAVASLRVRSPAPN